MLGPTGPPINTIESASCRGCGIRSVRLAVGIGYRPPDHFEQRIGLVGQAALLPPGNPHGKRPLDGPQHKIQQYTGTHMGIQVALFLAVAHNLQVEVDHFFCLNVASAIQVFMGSVMKMILARPGLRS